MSTPGDDTLSGTFPGFEHRRANRRDGEVPQARSWDPWSVTAHRSVGIRIAIALMVLDHLNNGVWALLSARGYYGALPGASDGNPSETILVLVRDLGIARLTLAALLITAAVLLERRVLLVALGVASLAGVLRLVAHLAGDRNAAWFNWVGYGLGALVPVVLGLLIWRTGTRTGAA